MEDDSTLYVGLDVHKDSITVAYAAGMGEVELFGKIRSTDTEVDRMSKRLQRKWLTPRSSRNRSGNTQ